MTAGNAIDPASVRWEILPSVRSVIEGIGSDNEVQKEALQAWLCEYFSGGCNVKGQQISPLGASGKMKKFKARWGIPGAGKRGGLRLAIATYCETCHVVIAGAWVRKEDPNDAEIDDAFNNIWK